MREAYRHAKHALYAAHQDQTDQIALMCIYTSDQLEAFDTIKQSLQKAIHRLIAKKDARA